MQIEFNDDLPLIFNFPNYRIPAWDQIYDHVWYLNPEYSTAPKYSGEKIWVWRVSAGDKSHGTKDMGYVEPASGKNIDVVFISYHEPNAEENWQRLLTKAPNAKRVDGVTGILEAHKAAAELATTDLFYAVDGDAYIVDDFEFDFVPDIFERSYAHVFNSVNPINRLEYGYGGVKLLPREIVLAAQPGRTDITTSLGCNFNVVDRISNVTAFNCDAFSAWRSAFRECAKLSAGVIYNSDADENRQRIHMWQTVGSDQPYGPDAIRGAILGTTFGARFHDKPEKMLLINDREWMRKTYDKRK